MWWVWTRRLVLVETGFRTTTPGLPLVRPCLQPTSPTKVHDGHVPTPGRGRSHRRRGGGPLYLFVDDEERLDDGLTESEVA